MKDKTSAFLGEDILVKETSVSRSGYLNTQNMPQNTSDKFSLWGALQKPVKAFLWVTTSVAVSELAVLSV